MTEKELRTLKITMDYCIKMEEYDTDYGLIRWEDTTADIVDDYGFRWRAWTYRPSPEQMREMKWEEGKDEKPV